MAFSWRRAHRLAKLTRHRDVREDLLRLGRYAPAPIQNTAAPARFCPHDWTTLWGAAALGYKKIVRRQLESGARVNARDPWGRTPLWWAVDECRREIAELLLAWAAFPDVPDEQGLAPLHVATLRGESELVELLLSHGALPDGPLHSDQPTPLMAAVRLGESELSARLLRAGARIDRRDRWGHTPLFYVRGASASNTLPLLREAGARADERAEDGDTALHRALRSGDIRLWKALALWEDPAALLALRGRADDTLLHAAAEGGNPRLIELLLAQGASRAAGNAFGHTPLLVALTAEHLPASTVLTQGEPPPLTFLEAVAMGDYDQAMALAPPPSSVLLDAPISGQETPLMGAVARGRADLAELLLRMGASPNAGTRILGTPLDIAVFADQPELVHLLLARGADPQRLRHVSPEQLRELLGETVEEESLPPVERLEGQRISAEALYEAAVAGDDALRFLLLCGANVDVRDAVGQTALIRAARDGDAPAAQRLLALGASTEGVRAAAHGRPALLALLDAIE